MTTYVQARDALVSHFHTGWSTAYPSIPAFYENAQSIDLDNHTAGFVKFDIDYEASFQASMEQVPITRVQGHVYITLATLEGTGTRTLAGYLDTLTTLMKYQSLSGVQTGAPSPMRSELSEGWYFQELAVPFWFDLY